MKKVFLLKYCGDIFAVCTSKRTAVEKSIELLLQKDFIKTDDIAKVRKDLNAGYDWSKNGYIVRINEISINQILNKYE